MPTLARMRVAEPPPDQRAGKPWMHFPSPLRYPGGKLKLALYIKLLIETNQLTDGEYAEVYAGGAAVALSLLFEDFVRHIHINDLDPGLYAFWSAVLDHNDEMVKRVRETTVTMDEWRRQRAIAQSPAPDPLDLAFATLFLNRTNRSGIITGGPIGGYAQAGTWRLDARFRREDLVKRIEKVGRHRSRISLYRLDGSDFLKTIAPNLPDGTLIYLDPPYYVKGQKELYANFYRPEDHAAISALVQGLNLPWLVSYDDAPEIRALYAARTLVPYGIPYAAQERYRGREVAFFADSLEPPAVANPIQISKVEAKAIRTALAS